VTGQESRQSEGNHAVYVVASIRAPGDQPHEDLAKSHIRFDMSASCQANLRSAGALVPAVSLLLDTVDLVQGFFTEDTASFSERSQHPVFPLEGSRPRTGIEKSTDVLLESCNLTSIA
jgi:hypothetical protein